MPKSPDETLFDLRPADENPETIMASLAAMEAFRSESIDKARSLRAAFNAGLASLPPAKLIALKGEASLLEDAANQAVELLKVLQDKHRRRLAEASHAELVMAKRALEIERAAFAERFNPKYRSMVAQFLDLMQGGEALRLRSIELEATINRFQDKCDPALGEVFDFGEPMPATPVSAAYFERVVLPEPDQARHGARWATLAWHGKHWIQEKPDGPTPEMALASREFETAARDARLANIERNRIEMENARDPYEIQNRRTREAERARREAAQAEAARTATMDIPSRRAHFLDQPGSTTPTPRPAPQTGPQSQSARNIHSARPHRAADGAVDPNQKFAPSPSAA